MLPEWAADRRCINLQVGIGDRRFSPTWVWIGRRLFLPFYLAQALLQAGEKMPALLLVNELAEELSIRFAGRRQDFVFEQLAGHFPQAGRSEEHTSELQSLRHLV